ncbi:TetR/AcrR family transcriptional regulator C-terminal domain-containing protein [Nocardia sp. AG03]|uniref:TetR/AcrR family transcriptional regulator C-terminal domain-containing protein n=1 Tax=Nocardia sp. AG03 TaxID=3025312 RepID=UPI0024181F7C|nr:TetR/AcrR family transcriptional regulator C-terminal domain-containing protein [Nocardia sp. AG03]
MCGEGSVGERDTEADDAIGECLLAAASSASWQDFLVRLAHGVRRIVLREADLFAPAASLTPGAPWARPPLGHLRWVEAFLDAMLSYGFDDDEAVATYRSFTTFLLGQLLLEAAGHLSIPDDERAPSHRALAEFPNLSRLQPKLSQDHGTAEFEDCLEALLDRIERMRANP